MSFFDSLKKFFRGKPEALKLHSCKDCYFNKSGYCSETDPPTRITSEYYAHGCTKYTTSTSVVVTT